MGRRRDLTLQTSNLGRRLMTLLKSEPLTLASRRRNVKIGRISEALVVKIWGQMEMIRRNSEFVRLIEVSKSTVDLMSGREVVMMGE